MRTVYTASISRRQFHLVLCDSVNFGALLILTLKNELYCFKLKTTRLSSIWSQANFGAILILEVRHQKVTRKHIWRDDSNKK